MFYLPVFENLMTVIQYHPEGHPQCGQFFFFPLPPPYGKLTSRRINSQYDT
jgi:hypothetical protein